MVTVDYHPHFEKTIRKISDAGLRERVKQQIVKIISDPSVGKPMRYCRKQTREVHIPPLRISYWFTSGRIHLFSSRSITRTNNKVLIPVPGKIHDWIIAVVAAVLPHTPPPSQHEPGRNAGGGHGKIHRERKIT